MAAPLPPLPTSPPLSTPRCFYLPQLKRSPGLLLSPLTRSRVDSSHHLHRLHLLLNGPLCRQDTLRQPSAKVPWLAFLRALLGRPGSLPLRSPICS